MLWPSQKSKAAGSPRRLHLLDGRWQVLGKIYPQRGFISVDLSSDQPSVDVKTWL